MVETPRSGACLPAAPFALGNDPVDVADVADDRDEDSSEGRGEDDGDKGAAAAWVLRCLMVLLPLLMLEAEAGGKKVSWATGRD